MGVPGVLFLCVANSARSQMAEALARAKFGDRLRIYSAGSRPTQINAYTYRAMAEAKLDISAHTSKHVDTIDPAEIDLVVTLCAEEVCPVPLRATRRIHWPIPDPAAGEMRDYEQMHQFRIARRTINAYLDGLEAGLALPPGAHLMPATSDDRAEVEALLRATGLPTDGLDDARFAIVRIAGVLAGCAGLEQWGPRGLLRSVAVAEPYRGQGIASSLVANRLAFAQSNLDVGVASVSLLTAVPAYFERHGFSRIERAQLAPELAASSQLASPACSTATAMHKVLFQTTDERLDESITHELAEHGTLVPPWVKYPDIPRRSIGWRMGAGEWYRMLFHRWWTRLSREEREAYRARWETPPEWASWWSD